MKISVSHFSKKTRFLNDNEVSSSFEEKLPLSGYANPDRSEC